MGCWRSESTAIQRRRRAGSRQKLHERRQAGGSGRGQVQAAAPFPKRVDQLSEPTWPGLGRRFGPPSGEQGQSRTLGCRDETLG